MTKKKKNTFSLCEKLRFVSTINASHIQRQCFKEQVIRKYFHLIFLIYSGEASLKAGFVYKKVIEFKWMKRL